MSPLPDEIGTRRAVLVVMDPIARIKPLKDTTLALMLAAQEAGWAVWCTDLDGLSVRDGLVMVRATEMRVFDDAKQWFTPGEVRTAPIGNFPLVLMRKDPPVDKEYVYATYWLELAERQGCRVVNSPRALRDCNEKGFITHFPELTAPTLIARDAQQLRAFHAEHGEIVLKPLDGMGGQGVFVIGRDGRNLGAVIEALTGNGLYSVMAQVYLPAISDGDKRILMIDGEPVDHVLARIPVGGETRGNLAAGGRGVVQPLSPADRAIAERVGPALQQRGLSFVGIDVIGDRLTEINVTSPTCLREIARETGQDIAGEAFAVMAKGL